MAMNDLQDLLKIMQDKKVYLIHPHGGSMSEADGGLYQSILNQTAPREAPTGGEELGNVEKEYLGSAGSDKYFYLAKKADAGGGMQDLLILDAEDKELASASSLNVDPQNVKEFVKYAVKKLDITMLSFDIVEKYFFTPEQKGEVKHEAPDKDSKGPDDTGAEHSDKVSGKDMSGVSGGDQEAQPGQAGLGARESRITEGVAYIAKDEAGKQYLVMQAGAGSLYYPIGPKDTKEPKDIKAASNEFEIHEATSEWKCQECGHHFNKNVPKGGGEMKCPKCHSTDIDMNDDIGEKACGTKHKIVKEELGPGKYATCEYCGKEMSPDNAGCWGYYKDKAGKYWKRNAYGDEGEDTSMPCGDCNVRAGGYHHAGCDNEQCTKCQGQALGCGCDFVTVMRALPPAVTVQNEDYQSDLQREQAGLKFQIGDIVYYKGKKWEIADHTKGTYALWSSDKEHKDSVEGWIPADQLARTSEAKRPDAGTVQIIKNKIANAEPLASSEVEFLKANKDVHSDMFTAEEMGIINDVLGEAKEKIKCRYCGKPSEDDSGVCDACTKKYESKILECATVFDNMNRRIGEVTEKEGTFTFTGNEAMKLGTESAKSFGDLECMLKERGFRIVQEARGEDGKINEAGSGNKAKDFKPGDYGLMSVFSTKELVLVRVMPWPSDSDEISGEDRKLKTGVKEPKTDGPVTVHYGLPSVHKSRSLYVEAVDKHGMGGDFQDKYYGKGTRHFVNPDNVFKNVSQLEKGFSYLYPHVLKKGIEDLRKGPLGKLLGEFGLDEIVTTASADGVRYEPTGQPADVKHAQKVGDKSKMHHKVHDPHTVTEDIDAEVTAAGPAFKDYVLKTHKHPWHQLSDETLRQALEDYKKEKPDLGGKLQKTMDKQADKMRKMYAKEAITDKQNPNSKAQEIFKKLIDDEIVQIKKDLGSDDALGMDQYAFHPGEDNKVYVDATLYDVLKGEAEYGFGRSFKEKLDAELHKAGMYLEYDGAGVWTFANEGKQAVADPFVAYKTTGAEKHPVYDDKRGNRQGDDERVTEGENDLKGQAGDNTVAGTPSKTYYTVTPIPGSGKWEVMKHWFDPDGKKNDVLKSDLVSKEDAIRYAINAGAKEDDIMVNEAFKPGDKVVIQPGTPISARFNGIGEVVTVEPLPNVSGGYEITVRDKDGAMVKVHDNFIKMSSTNATNEANATFTKYIKLAREYYDKRVPKVQPDNEDIWNTALEFMSDDGLSVDKDTEAALAKELGMDEAKMHEAKFGSVEWQDEQIAAIKGKLERGEELSKSDVAFIEIQLQHNKRAEIEELDRMWKASESKGYQDDPRKGQTKREADKAKKDREQSTVPKEKK